VRMKADFKSSASESAPATELAPNYLDRQKRRWLVATLVLVTLQALPNVTYPIGRDQATYCVIGRGLLQGKELYRDLWDIKPPAIFYTYAVIVKAFGPVMWSVGLLDILWLLVISYCVFRFAERYLGVGAAFLAAIINAAWHCRADYIDAAQPETFLVLFVFAAYFLAGGEGRESTARQFVAGVFLGLAFWFKYNALPFVPLVLLAPYLDTSRLEVTPRPLGLAVSSRRWSRNAVGFLVGFLTVVGSVVLYFWQAGLWEEFVHGHLRVAARYGALPYERLRQLYWVFLLVNTVKRLGPWATVGVLAASGVAWKRRTYSRLGPIFLAALAGYVSSAMQAHFPFYAFETCYPFCAMLWAYLIVEGYKELKRAWGKLRENGRPIFVSSLLAALTVAAAFPVILAVRAVAHRYIELGNWWLNPHHFYSSYPRQFELEHLNGQMRVVRYLRENLHAGDCIYVWGAHSLPY